MRYRVAAAEWMPSAMSPATDHNVSTRTHPRPLPVDPQRTPSECPIWCLVSSSRAASMRLAPVGSTVILAR